MEAGTAEDEFLTIPERLQKLKPSRRNGKARGPESGRPGLLLVVEARSIGEAAEADAVIARARQREKAGGVPRDGTEGDVDVRKLHEAEEALARLNRRRRSSAHQARRVLRRLRRAGFEVVQNTRPRGGKGSKGGDGGAGGKAGGKEEETEEEELVFYVRLRLSERMLMLAADEMGDFWKRCKPALVPEDSGAALGELPAAPTIGGFLPYSLARADAFADAGDGSCRNVGEGGVLAAESAVGKGGFCSGLGWDLLPTQRLGGIFELPYWPSSGAGSASHRVRVASNPAALTTPQQEEGDAPASSFTQAETLHILWWWLEHKTGLDVIQPKLPASGGRLELWERRSEEARELAMASAAGKPAWGYDLGGWLASSEWGGAAVGMLHFTALTPYHTPVQQTWLENHWAFAVGRAFRRYGLLRPRFWRALASQPLEQIRDYFGTKVALYFAFVEFFWRALLVPALFSVAIYGYALYCAFTRADNLGLLSALRQVHESWATPLFAFCICSSVQSNRKSED